MHVREEGAREKDEPVGTWDVRLPGTAVCRPAKRCGGSRSESEGLLAIHKHGAVVKISPGEGTSAGRPLQSGFAWRSPFGSAACGVGGRWGQT